MPLVNNPGGGNCGYYAFSIAMIEIIQQQLQIGRSELLDSLNAQLPEDAEQFKEADFQNFALAAYAKDSSRYQREFLDRLQRALRNIARSSYQQHLSNDVREEILRREETLTKVEGNETFMKFMNIVYAFAQGRALRKKETDFNELAYSEDVKAFAREIVANFRSVVDGQSLSSEDQDHLLLQMAKARFMEDTVMLLEDDFIPRPDSMIVSALAKIEENGYWATHDHLKKIAEVLKVNLAINGHNCGQMQVDFPTVVLNNASNVHWTTEVQSLEAVASKKPQRPLQAPSFSEKEQKVFDVATAFARANGIQQGVLIDYLEFLVRYAKDDSIFKVNADEVDTDLALAKELQEEELISVGLRPLKKA